VDTHISAFLVVAVVKHAPEHMKRSSETGQPAAPRAVQAKPSAQQESLDTGQNHVVRGSCVVKTTPTITPNPTPE
jgi:hypothetical protein